MKPRLFPLLALASSAMLVAPIPVRADPATELERAYETLHETSYRQRESRFGMAASGGTAPIISEHAKNRSRVVTESVAPSLGRVRQERVTIGRRTAVRTLAPGVAMKAEETPREMRSRRTRALLGRVASVGTAVALSGGSRSALIHTAVGTAAAVQSTAQASAALDGTVAGYDGSWQVVPADSADALAGPVPVPKSIRVEKSATADGNTEIFTSRSLDGSIASIVTVNAAAGVPVLEENYAIGQLVSRVEYFDIGAPVVIEIPDCLR